MDSVRLDDTLGAGDLIGLGGRLAELDPDRMQTHGLPVVAERTSGGAAIVTLDEPAAQPVLELFRGVTDAAPVTTTTAPPPTPAQVTVDVLNGSGVDGEARRVLFVMSSQGGFGEGGVETADPTARTVIAHPPESEAMAELVAAWIEPDAEFVVDEDLEPATGAGHPRCRLRVGLRTPRRTGAEHDHHDRCRAGRPDASRRWRLRGRRPRGRDGDDVARVASGSAARGRQLPLSGVVADQ